jgi:2-polyprenyl-3-methyl-5-hydroxy-6-metoxy-1,4-benzoquinol methylase
MMNLSPIELTGQVPDAMRGEVTSALEQGNFLLIPFGEYDDRLKFLSIVQLSQGRLASMEHEFDFGNPNRFSVRTFRPANPSEKFRYDGTLNRIVRTFDVLGRYFSPKSTTVLDVAAGDGIFSLAAVARGYKQVMCVDRDTSWVSRIRRAAWGLGLKNLDAVSSSVEDMQTNLADRTYDVAICQGIFNHIPDFQTAIESVSTKASAVYIGTGFPNPRHESYQPEMRQAVARGINYHIVPFSEFYGTIRALGYREIAPRYIQPGSGEYQWAELLFAK